MKNKQQIIPIKPELRGLIEEFLAFEEYHPIFKEFAKIIGYHGNNMTKIKKLLFAPNDNGEIGFSISGMEELLLEFQLLKQLINKEPYKSLLIEYPEAIQNIRNVAIKMLNQEDIDETDLTLMFNTDNYDKIRKDIDEGKNSSS